MFEQYANDPMAYVNEKKKKSKLTEEQMSEEKVMMIRAEYENKWEIAKKSAHQSNLGKENIDKKLLAQKQEMYSLGLNVSY